MSSPASASSYTFRESISGATHFNVLDFFFRRQQARVRIATVVEVMAVTNDGDVSAVGFVDVQPLVQQVDGLGNTVNLPTVYHVPYLRLQGGTNAIILDPQVGDLGIAVFADRDISAVKSNKKVSPPGSRRSNDLADALYLGGILNGVPQQYVQFNDDGITVNSPSNVTAQIGTDSDAARIVMDGDGIVLSFGGNSITINDDGIAVSGPQTNDSSITAQGEVIANGTTPLHTHEHSGVTTGSGTSGPPTA